MNKGHPATLAAACAHLPATTAQLAQRHGIGPTQAWSLMHELVRQRYAEEWGRELNERGRLVPVFFPTGKETL